MRQPIFVAVVVLAIGFAVGCGSSVSSIDHSGSTGGSGAAGSGTAGSGAAGSGAAGSGTAGSGTGTGGTADASTGGQGGAAGGGTGGLGGVAGGNTGGQGGTVDASGGGGTSGADGGITCSPACVSGHICVGIGTEGGALVLANDAGVCPTGTHQSGTSDRCDRDLAYTCTTVPAGCGGTVTCACASSLCPALHTCRGPSDGVLSCVEQVP